MNVFVGVAEQNLNVFSTQHVYRYIIYNNANV